MVRIKVQEALKRKLQVGKIFIFGSEEYLSRQLLKKLLSSIKYETFYPDNINQFFDFTGLSLFNGEVIPVILHAEELPSKLKKKSEKERFLKKLRELNSFIIVAFSQLDWKALKGEIFKGIIDSSTTLVKSEPYQEKQIYNLILKKFKGAGKSISPKLVKLIVDLVGTDLTELKNETDKLILFPGELDEGIIKSLLFTGGKVNPFDLITPLLKGERREFIKGVEELIQRGFEPLQILGLLQSQVRNLIDLSSGRNVRVPKEALSKYKELTKFRSQRELLQILKRLHLAEFSIKMGEMSGKEALISLAFLE